MNPSWSESWTDFDEIFEAMLDMAPGTDGFGLDGDLDHHLDPKCFKRFYHCTHY